jgi:hypothetical protein
MQAKTWYGNFVGLLIFRATNMSGNIDLSDETKNVACRLMLWALIISIIEEIILNLQIWLYVLTIGVVQDISKRKCKHVFSFSLLHFKNVSKI